MHCHHCQYCRQSFSLPTNLFLEKVDAPYGETEKGEAVKEIVITSTI